MNVILKLEYELASYYSAVHRFNHYTTRTPHKICGFRLISSLMAINHTEGFFCTWWTTQYSIWMIRHMTIIVLTNLRKTRTFDILYIQYSIQVVKKERNVPTARSIHILLHKKAVCRKGYKSKILFLIRLGKEVIFPGRSPRQHFNLKILDPKKGRELFFRTIIWLNTGHLPGNIRQ